MNGRAEHADPNHVLFFEAQHEYRVSHPVSAGDDCTVFTMDEGVLAALLDSARIRRKSSAVAFAARSLPVDSNLFLAHRRLYATLGEDRTDPLAAEESSLALMRQVLGQGREASMDDAARPGTRRRLRNAVAAVQACLAAHFSDNLTLDDVAAAASYSKFHLSRVFAKATGTSIHQYRNRLRLRAALEHLADPALDLSAIAFQVGFSSHSHFTQAFREEFGSTPSRVREALEAGRSTGCVSGSRIQAVVSCPPITDS